MPWEGQFVSGLGVKRKSGLAVNIDETKVVKIGTLRVRSIPWDGEMRGQMDQYLCHLRYFL